MEKLDVAGGHISYWDTGSGPTLVVVHGTGTPGSLLRTDMAALDRQFRVITYDRRGYGASSESPRSWEAHREDAVRLMTELGAGPAVVMGYSGGAIVALDLALERPELVSGLVLLDPSVYVRRHPTPGLARAFLKMRLLQRTRGDRAAAESFVRYVSSYSTGGTAWDKAVPERRETILASAAGILADLGSGSGEHIAEERLAGISVPVTIVDAALSPPFLRNSVARLRRLIPQARNVTLEQSSHIVMLDAREDVLDVLRRAVTEPARVSRRSTEWRPSL